MASCDFTKVSFSKVVR